MKILILSHISDLVGGAERSVIEVLSIWEKEHNIEPVFILREPVSGLAAELDKRGWRWHSLPFSYWAETRFPVSLEEKHRYFRGNLGAIARIEKMIEFESPDLVMTNSVVSPWAALAAHYAQVPHIWFVREYGDLDHGKKFLMERHEIFEDIDSLSQLVVTNSKAMASHIKKYISEEKITFIYHPFDIDDLVERSKEKVESPFESSTSLKLIIISGSITRTKGQHDVVEAIGMLHQRNVEIEVCIIGKQDDKKFMRQLKDVAEQWDVKDRVKFLGYKSNPLAYVKFADVGVMASRMEAFGRTTFEYLALSKPVVGVNSGATPEMVRDEHNGYLYGYGKSDQLAHVLEKYARDPSLIEKHGEKSLKQAKKMLESEHNQQALFKKVENVVSKSAATLVRPIHFNRLLLEYPEVVEAYAEELNRQPLSTFLYKKLYGVARSIYRVLKRLRSGV